MITEITQDDMLKWDLEQLRSFEPFWKLILGNKALLPLLWQMYPNHENLLPAYFDDPKTELTKAGKEDEFSKLKHFVSKPLFGREGLGVMVSKNFTSYDKFVKQTEINFGVDTKTNEKLGKSVYQAYVELASA